MQRFVQKLVQKLALEFGKAWVQNLVFEDVFVQSFVSEAGSFKKLCWSWFKGTVHQDGRGNKSGINR